MLRHLVMFKFDEPSDVAECDVRLNAMFGRIPTCLSLETAKNVREHPFAYDLLLITTHEDLAGLMAYQDHPVHLEFVDWLNPRVAGRVVLDHY